MPSSDKKAIKIELILLSFITSLESIIQISERIKKLRPQEKHFLEYIKNVLQTYDKHLINDSVAAGFLRKSFLTLNLLARRIPERADKERSFAYYFFNDQTRGPIFEEYYRASTKLMSDPQYKIIWQSVTIAKNEIITHLDLSNLELDVDFLTQLFKQSHVKKSLKVLNLSGITVNYKYINELSETEFTRLTQAIMQLESLELLIFDDNNLGSDRVRQKEEPNNKGGAAKAPLSMNKCAVANNLNTFKTLFRMPKLNSISLRNNFINDTAFKTLFDGASTSSLSTINLTTNFLLLEDTSCERIYQGLQGRLNLACNYIHNPNIALPNITTTINTESVINPEYFINNKRWLVTVLKEKKDPHAAALIERMDGRGQLKLTYHHLTGDNCFYRERTNSGVIELDEPKRSSAYSFATDRHLYTFGKFSPCKPSRVLEVEQELKKRKNEPNSVAFAKFFPLFEERNCCKFAICDVYNRIVKKTKHKMSVRFFATPNFNIHNKILPYSDRLSFPRV